MLGYHDLQPELPAQTRDERRQNSRTRIFAVFVINHFPNLNARKHTVSRQSNRPAHKALP
jgi:hypothetical protein